MAIKYFHVDQQYKTIGVLDGCRYDCVNKIRCMLEGTNIKVDEKKYLMNDTIRAVVVACDEDKNSYSRENGKICCKKKLMKKYYKQFDTAMDRFKNDMEKVMKKF